MKRLDMASPVAARHRQYGSAGACLQGGRRGIQGGMPHSTDTRIIEAKAALRARMKALRAAFGEAERAEAARRLAAMALPETLLPPEGGVIAGYWPMKGELDPLPLMKALAQRGYGLALPRITPQGLDFHLWRHADLMEAGAFGTREPRASAPRATPHLILTPLLAFDDAGGRLGFGKGFYDRAFAALPGAKRLGLAYAFQRVETVPGEAHDVPLDAVIAV